MIKLNKKGAPKLATRKLLNDMNDLLDNMSNGDSLEFNKTYNSVEELEQAYAQMKGKVNGASSSAKFTPNNTSSESTKSPIEDAKVESVSSSDDFSDDIPDNFDDFDFDPNAGDKIKRGYNDETVSQTQTETIGEPIFSQETIVNEQVDPSNPQPQGGFQQPQGQNGQKQPKEPDAPMANPALNEADEKTKRIAAEQFVDMLLGGYDTLHEVAKPFAKIKDKKIMELERKGLINPSDTVTVNKGDEVTLREIIHESNLAIEQALTPDPTFHAIVRPPMIREFTKRGLGLTDMQTIAIAFGKDIGMKLVQIIGVKRNLGSIIDIFKEQQKERQEGIRKQNVQQFSPDSISSAKPTVEQEVFDSEPVMETEDVN